jgi:tetratricopeptide (TPR) repeat protein
MAQRKNGTILAVSTQEQYAYRYIVELYDTGDNVSLAKETYQFQALYPNSVYLPYVRFIDANLSLEAGDNQKAQRIYTELLTDGSIKELRAELLLNFAISLKQSGDYAKAMNLLQRIDSEVADPTYSAEAAIQRAAIYYKQGQYFSAERAYRVALSYFPNDNELQLGLFSCLVKLQKDEEALGLLWSQDPSSTTYRQFLPIWLEYLLANERYNDFDTFMKNNVLGAATKTTVIYDICIRRALLKGDYAAADSILAITGTPNSHFLFYKTLVLQSRGEFNLSEANFRTLVKDPDPEVSIPSYLESLKFLYKSEPLSAITQLTNFIKTSPSNVKKTEMYYTLGYFCYNMKDYSEAIKQLSLAKQFDMGRELSSRIDMLIAESWLALGRTDLAMDAFNKFLNQYTESSNSDKALFHIGYINFTRKDYSQAKQALTRLTVNYPQSTYFKDAIFYQGEMDFYLANYNVALQSYLKLNQINSKNNAVSLRIAQVYYYLGDYAKAEQYIGELLPSYESCILKGNILVTHRNYTSAIEQFLLAESFAEEPLRKAEAQSYRALCLYQLKRYKEASALYLKLFNAKESQDTYLFLSAKSAYAAQDYNQALQLFDTFIDEYPNSQLFLSALSNMANSYYNMGNYMQAVEDWINILKRFRNSVNFSDSELAIVKDALLGIDLGIKRLDGLEITDDLISLPDTFSSEFIKFEINLILLKSYASNDRWADIIASAEKIRSEYPQRNTDEVAMLMVKSYIEMNQYEEADTLLSEIYQLGNSNEALLKWAELEMLTGNYTSALNKYKQSFVTNPITDTWLSMLECSSKLEFIEFDELWSLGSQFGDSQAIAGRYRLNQLYMGERFNEAGILATSMLNNSLSTLDHAQAFLILGLIDFQNQNYSACIASLKRVILLFPEFPEVRKSAIIHTIKAQIASGAITEAEMHLNLYARDLDLETLTELNQLVEKAK